MSRFTDWSQKAAINPTVWTKPDRPPAMIEVMTIPAGFARYPVKIEDGQPEANIALDHARIRFPDPFADDDLSALCRDFLIKVVEQAVDRDGRLRWLRWKDGSLLSCNPINGRRHHQTSPPS